MEFKSPIELVKQFNKSFGVITKKTPEVLQEEDWSLKAKLMKEELSEYIEACEKSDIVDIADAVAYRYAIHFIRYCFSSWPSKCF